MNVHLPWSKLAAVALLSCGIAGAAESRFGELPVGSLGTAQTYGVSAEICREHVFNPEEASVALPQGYQINLVSEAARKNSALKLLLEANPQVRNYALGVLCFVLADRLVIEDSPDQIVSPARIAFWWVSANGPQHSGMRGKAQWVQLGSWYASETPNRSAVLKADPMAQFVDLQVGQAGPTRWNIRLNLPNEVVTAEVETSKTGTPSKASQPSFMSVPMSGRSAAYFTVYTYSGHVHRFAQGTWRATGTGVFSNALAVVGEDQAFETVFQEGWVSRSGVYPFVPK